MYACKRILGLSSQSPNHIVYGELGRHHLSVLASTRCVKYWLRLNKISSNKYLKCPLDLSLPLSLPPSPSLSLSLFPSLPSLSLSPPSLSPSLPPSLFLSPSPISPSLSLCPPPPPLSLLQGPEIPERLSGSNTWNCSMPHWWRFKRHFRCNLRQECVNGEDEVQCPYSPCSHGGVSIAHHCYFYVKRYVTWLTAQRECRKLGAYLASLASPREWIDVLSWLRLVMRFNWKSRMHIGLMPAPPNLPYM